MTTVEALRVLYAALGGNAKDVEAIQTTPNMIVAIAEQITATSSEESPTPEPESPTD